MVYMITLENIFVQAIEKGEKTIEVRTRIPKDLSPGDALLIAQKASHGRVVLWCRISQILEMHPNKLYANYSEQIHCSFSYFQQYTCGRDKIFGIVLTDIHVFPNYITTQAFFVERAPQWFAYVPSILLYYHS